jgi:drug/metabolite transporter (DMT)-like permease
MFKTFFPQISIANNNLHTSDCSPLSIKDLINLGLLAAIWGASFIAMRVAVPEVGALLSANLRISLAAFALLLFVRYNKIPLHWQRNLKPYATAGFFGAVLPFILFAYAAHHLPAALSALFNATCPLFGALFSAVWLAERFSLRKLTGLLLGVAGVWLLVGAGTFLRNQPTLLSICACLAGAACFAISGVVVKRYTCTRRPLNDRIEPMAMATGAMVAASVMILPTMAFSLPSHMPSPQALGLVVALALFPSALAQIIFIPLVARIGPTRAMSVSFLIPLFSILWGFIFLQETIGLSCVLGGLTVLTATGLVVKP